MFNNVTRIWTVERGDTLSKIALAIYNDANKWPLIYSANKELIKNPNLIFPKWKIHVPEKAKRNSPKTFIDNNDDFLIVASGTNLDFVSSLTLNTGINVASRTAAFSVPYSEQVKDIFKAYQPIQIYIRGKLFLDGIMIRPKPTFSLENGSIMSIEVISKAHAIIQSSYKATKDIPRSWKNISLQKLLNIVLTGFDINVFFDDLSIQNQIFDKIGIESSETIFSFIQKIAQQKGYLIQGLPTGDLKFTKSNISSKPVFLFQNDSAISASYDYDNLAKTYRVTNERDKNGAFVDVSNDFIKYPIFKQISDNKSLTGDLQSRAEWLQAQEFAKALKVSINANDITIDGTDNLWEENTIVEVKSPQNGYFKETLFLIENITFNLSKDGRIATLNLVLPELRSGQMPKEMPFL